MTARLVLIVTSPRVPAGLLTYDAWTALRSGVVMTRDQDHPHRDALAAAGVVTEAVDPSHPPVAIARLLLNVARESGTAVWLAGPGGDDDVAHALADAGVQAAERGEQVDLEVIYGSWDVPGARLLDVVTTMDRLRSPGGCPWDAQQTHESLAPYLLEEAYEAYDAILADDTDALREELGDVLLQIVLHAALAEPGWSVDDVAGGLVDKLIRRNPHVFAGAEVAGLDDIVANWERIKKAEKARSSALDGIALAQPALSLAAKVLARLGGAAPPLPDGADLGAELLRLVADARQRAEDPEAALRATVLAYMEAVRATEPP